MDFAPFDSSLISAVHQPRLFFSIVARISFWGSFKNAGQLHEKHSRGRITLASKKKSPTRTTVADNSPSQPS